MRRAFTLIELLVVIAIIGILIAMLVPVFVNAREQGRQTVCVSNLKQISAAFIMYQENYDDFFPAYARHRISTPQNGCSNSCHWSPPLKAYLPNPFLTRNKAGVASVFLCPSAENDKVNSYAMNLFLGDTQLRPGQTRPERRGNIDGVIVSDVKRPSQTVLVYDTPISVGEMRDLDYWGTRWSYWKASQPGDLSETLPITDNRRGDAWRRPRHRNGNAVSFVDGHVKWIRNIRPYTTGKPYDARRFGTDGFLIE